VHSIAYTLSITSIVHQLSLAPQAIRNPF
jgi:hypothetical protein